MKSIAPYITVKPILDHKKKHNIGEIELQIENQFEKNLRLAHPQLGIVVAVPNRKCKVYNGNEYDCVLQVGDLVFMEHFCFFDHSYKKQDHVVVDGEELYKVRYEDCIFGDRNGELFPCNNYLLCEEITENNFEADFLIVPETSKKVVKNKYKVLHLPNIDTDIKVGDVVVNHIKMLAYPLTYKNKNYYRCVLDELVAIEK